MNIWHRKIKFIVINQSIDDQFYHRLKIIVCLRLSNQSYVP